MPRRGELTISKQSVDGLSVEGKEAVFWDRELPGFGVRVYPSGSKIYVAQSRGPNGIKRLSLGRHGEITADEARKQAAAAIARIKQGEDPSARPLKRALTVADLAERYMEGHVKVHCNAHTQGIYAGSLRNHILPAFGTMAVTSVGRAEVAAFHYRLRETPRAANRALMVLSKIFSLAEAWGQAPPGGNPCRFVLRYKEGRRERFLTEEEYRRVGQALCELEAEGPMQARAAAALRLIMLTGCRLGEVLTLKWSDVDRKSGEIRLRDAKTGARMVPLTPEALRVLAGVRAGQAEPVGVPGRQAGSPPVAADRLLAPGAGAGGGGGRADPRPSSQLRLAGLGPRPRAPDDRAPSRPHGHRQHRPLRPSLARGGEDCGGPCGRQHRSRRPAGGDRPCRRS